MKKIFFSLFFICLFLAPALADFTVDSVAFTAEVADDGSAQVSTEYQLTFDAVVNSVEIPLPEGTLSNIAVTGYRFDTVEGDGGTVVQVTSTAGFGGKQSFVVTYDVAADYTSDDTDGITYSLSMLSSQWARTIQSFRFSVTMPDPYNIEDDSFTMSPQLVGGYNGPVDNAESDLSITGNTVTGSVSNRMAYDSMRFEVMLPLGYFYVHVTTLPVINVSIASIIMGVIWALCILYWLVRLRRRGHLNISMRMMPPEGLLACQLPMVLDGRTIDVAVLILEWANLGYLSIRYRRKKPVSLIWRMPMGSERSKAEQLLFRQIFAGDKTVECTRGRFSAAAAKYRASSRRQLSKVQFDRRSGNVVLVQIPCRLLCAAGVGIAAYRLLPSDGIYLVLAILIGIPGFLYSIYLHIYTAQYIALRQGKVPLILLLVLAAGLIVAALFAGALPEMAIGLLACLFSAAATAHGPRRSERGLESLEQVLSCRRFYKEVVWKRLQILNGNDRRFFQKQLPRAAALGLSKTFAEAFDRLPCPKPEWLLGVRFHSNSAQSIESRVRVILRCLRRTFR